MKPSGIGQPKQGERTGTSCPVCGDAVLQQEKYGRSGAIDGYRQVCSRRGCPWQSQVR